MDPKFEMIKIMNTKQIYSIETGKLITFYSQITDEMYENTPTPFSDGLTLIEDDFEDEVITIYVRQLEKPKKKVELTSIDELIDWSEEEEWQE